MRYAVISDIHSNLEAFRAVVADIRTRAVSAVFFAGDAVGYGPDPDACTLLLKETCSEAVAGNHDWAAIGSASDQRFNEMARRALAWTRTRLSERSIEHLRGLPLTSSLEDHDAFLVHASPKDPASWRYLLSMGEIRENYEFFSQRICYLGHSHTPFIAEQLPSGGIQIHRGSVTLEQTGKYIVNCGSVGQPRDGDPRACYVIFDDGAVQFPRVEYAVEETQRKMALEGLPDMLIERLARGR